MRRVPDRAPVAVAKANNGNDDTRGQLGVLAAADDGAGRMLATTLRSLSGERDDRLYVHAKVGIFDDRWLTIGSANLNAHSLLNDTEMNVVCDDPDLASDTRLRLWAEHLDVDAATIAHESPHATIDDRWRPIAFEQLERLRAGAPADPPAAGAARPVAAVEKAARPARWARRRRLNVREPRSGPGGLAAVLADPLADEPAHVRDEPLLLVCGVSRPDRGQQ